MNATRYVFCYRLNSSNIYVSRFKDAESEHQFFKKQNGVFQLNWLEQLEDAKTIAFNYRVLNNEHACALTLTRVITPRWRQWLKKFFT